MPSARQVEADEPLRGQNDGLASDLYSLLHELQVSNVSRLNSLHGRGRVLFAEGEPARGVYILRTGRASLRRRGNTEWIPPGHQPPQRNFRIRNRSEAGRNKRESRIGLFQDRVRPFFPLTAPTRVCIASLDRMLTVQKEGIHVQRS